MYCHKCGEENPDKAQFCRNCGSKLKEDVKKTEIIEDTTQNTYTESSTTTSSSSDDNSNLTGCCACLIGIFIIGAILSLLGL